MTFTRDGVTLEVLAHLCISAERGGVVVVDQLIAVDIKPRSRREEGVMMLRELSANYLGKPASEWREAVLLAAPQGVH